MTPVLTDSYAAYHGDCVPFVKQLERASVALSVYSPPFAGLYQYSSDPRDMSNCLDREEFFEHYAFLVADILRATMPGRCSAVHCADVYDNRSGSVFDLPGAIVQSHVAAGWRFVGRHAIWKEPLAVRMRTMAKGLAHKQIVEDAVGASIAHADYLLVFKAPGENAVPVTYPNGLMDYAGERKIPADIMGYRGWTGLQTENRFSHWIWRQYASSFWDDVRIDRVVPFEESRDDDDERHVHPLQLDVIERSVILRSNPGEVVLSPFMGVGSEVYAAVRNGRRAIGVELKESYFKQAVKNLSAAVAEREAEQSPLFTEQESTENHRTSTSMKRVMV